MAFLTTFELMTQKVTMGDLREFIQRAENARDEEMVAINVSTEDGSITIGVEVID